MTNKKYHAGLSRYRHELLGEAERNDVFVEKNKRRACSTKKRRQKGE